jgi:hypothetical protein
MTASKNTWFSIILKGFGLCLLILFLEMRNNDSTLFAFELSSVQSSISAYSMNEPGFPEADFYLAQGSLEDPDDDEDLDGDEENLDGDEENLDDEEEDLDGEEEDLDGEGEGLDEEEEGLDEDDMLSSDESDDDGEATEFETQVKVKQKYKLMTGRSTDKRGFSLGSGTSDRSDEAHFINKHEIALRVRTSPTSSYYFRLESKFDQKNDYIEEKYEDVYGLNVREGYYNYQSDAHSVRLGNQILKLGKVDLDSPLDVLNKSNSDATNNLDTEESKLPAPIIRYKFQGENNAFTFLASPFYQETDGQEYSRKTDESTNSENGEDPESFSYVKNYFGLQYQFSGNSIDFKLGAFRWYDKDAEMSWEDKKVNAYPGDETRTQEYREKETHMKFVEAELEVTFSDLVWKTDMGYFQKKNFYDFFKDGDEKTEIKTVQLDYLGLATSFEARFDEFLGMQTLYFMTIFSYRSLKDAPENTHILGYENEAEPKTEIRDISKQQLSLFMLFEFTNNFNTTLMVSQTAPYQQSVISNNWMWKPSAGNSTFELKFYQLASPTQKMIEKEIISSKYYFHYTYEF